MEKTEPSFAPEWLKNAGSVNCGFSISNSDGKIAPILGRNKSFADCNVHDVGRAFGFHKTTSSYFRRSSSSNGSGRVRSQSSVCRNRFERDWEKNKYDSPYRDKSVWGDHRHHDLSDASGDTSSSKFEMDELRHSQPMVSGKRGETWNKRVVADSSCCTGNQSNGLATKVGVVRKTTHEKEFPSLGTEERAIISVVGTVQSLGLSSTVQSLPIITSPTVNGEIWTSALAEVPSLVGSNGNGSLLKAASLSSSAVSSGTNPNFNMAEAVAQGPSHAQTAPLLSVETQRLEELSIKQSRQLIPVTPSMPKTLVFNSVDKQKIKASQQQHPVSSLGFANHTARGGPVKTDVPKAWNLGKLHILKLGRENNGATPIAKDVLSPTSFPVTAPPVSGAAATRRPQNNPVSDSKATVTILEKRPTSLALSRNDFFNSVRKKSLAHPTSVPDSPIAHSSSTSGTSGAISPPVKPAAMVAIHASGTYQLSDASPNVTGDNCLSEMKSESTCNGDSCISHESVSNGNKHLSTDLFFPEDEVAAFLRSLGWEENPDEGGLTEEEISAYYRDTTKYTHLKLTAVPQNTSRNLTNKCLGCCARV